ncbi:regulatory protein [Marinitoga hydrogenitolerans DSM 16785]|uniref:Regulatory protein RecX n=1 Tax=Marinitoga hydrogenitolerans (strain DSM 16785 / JCM 12826 / AT1271) TaxID=1122195 RepID=A0A1M4TGR4_MARH1|nr:regulatory protein RecX [Marinitoga hydrogenitolerans]SHE43663.1 regulatory protein [Marinitoga hydrogenitolerans DSM 16785]
MKRKKSVDPFDEDSAQKSAINLLKFRARSEFEMKSRLLEKGFDEGVIDRIIDKLKEFKMLDDELFAYFYAYDKLTLNKKGPYIIKMELSRKFHIEENIIYAAIDKVLKEINLKEIIRDIILSQLKLKKDKRKIKEYLYKRGFDMYLVEEVLNEVGGE